LTDKGFVPPPPAYDPEKGTGTIGAAPPVARTEKKPDSTIKAEEGAAEKKKPDLPAINLMKEIARVDFPEMPALDKDGVPVFDELDEHLSFQPCNDLGNAQRFLKRHAKKIIYVEKNGWFGWTGTHWSFEEGERRAQKAAYETAKLMKREALAIAARGAGIEEGEDEKAQKAKINAHNKRVLAFRKFAHECGNLKRLNPMLTIAQTFIALQHDIMDTHKYLVTVDNGIIDLRPEGAPGEIKFTGKHDPDKFISKKMNVRYDAKAEAPVFKKALEEILPDPEMRKFLQTWYGYCLTGSVSAKAVLMMQGGGDNGKSLIIELMNELFDNYSCGIPIESLMTQKNKSGANASPDLARLPGARVVTAAEPEEGMQFSESFIKVISGADKMTVRRMFEDFFEFYAQFKLVISCNAKPQVRGGDEAFWGRIYLMPFEMRFLAPERMSNPAKDNERVRDETLPGKLRKEMPGILNWLIEGYHRYAKEGLQRPANMTKAIQEYRAETNSVLQFIDSWCQRDGSMKASHAYDAYFLWAKVNAVEPIGKIGFWKKLKTFPFVKKVECAGGNYYDGIALNDHGDAEFRAQFSPKPEKPAEPAQDYSEVNL
jgi:putative DNA primase/helicase